MDQRSIQLELENGSSVPVQVPSEIELRRLVPALVHKLGLPVIDEDGGAITYLLRTSDDSVLDPDLSLAEQHVADNAHLKLRGVQPIRESPSRPTSAPPTPSPSAAPRRTPEQSSPRRRRGFPNFFLIILLVGACAFFSRSVFNRPESISDAGIESVVTREVVELPAEPTARPSPTRPPIATADVAAAQLEARLIPDLLFNYEGNIFVVRATADAVYELWMLSDDSENAKRVAILGAGFSPYVYDIVLRPDGLYFMGESQDADTLVRKRLSLTTGDVSLIEWMPQVGRTIPVKVGEQWLFRSPTEADRLVVANRDFSELALVADVGVPAGWYENSQMIDNILYFVGETTPFGAELWRSDGTVAGTWQVTDLVAGLAGANPQLLAVVENQLYMSTDASSDSGNLWQSDGSRAGTVQFALPTAQMVVDLYVAEPYWWVWTATTWTDPDVLWRMDREHADAAFERVDVAFNASEPERIVAVDQDIFLLETDDTAQLTRIDAVALEVSVPYQVVDEASLSQLTLFDNQLFFLSMQPNGAVVVLAYDPELANVDVRLTLARRGGESVQLVATSNKLCVLGATSDDVISLLCTATAEEPFEPITFDLIDAE